MRRCLGLLLLLVFVTGCSVPGAPLNNRSETHAIVLVPGYKGSLLESSQGELVWITSHEAVWGNRSLALPAPGVVDPLRLQPKAILRSLNLLGLFGDKYYGPILDTLRKNCTNSRIVEFPYDWRQSASKSAGDLAKLIETLRNDGVRSIDLVAHSFGGLIVSWYLRFGSQPISTAVDRWNFDPAVKRVVLAGVPYHGAFQMFHDLKTGSTQGFNSRILDQESLSTFPSSFELLPYGESGPVSSSFDVSYWEQEKVGLFANNGLIDQKRQFIRDNLLHAASFKQKVLANDTSVQDGIKAFELLVVVGNQPDTADVEAAAGGSFVADPHVEGDDTVPSKTAMPPKAILDRTKWVMIKTRLPHYRLLDDIRIQEFLCPVKEPGV